MKPIPRSAARPSRIPWICALAIAMLAAAAPGGSIVRRGIPEETRDASKNCGALHAGIRAEFVPRRSGFSDPNAVMLSFILLNDGNTPINSVTGGGWILSVDGKELPESGFIFGNGPGPVGGWGVLKPGEWYEFGKSLPVGKYFRETREYKVSWKGGGFQSSTITVKIE